VCAARVTEKMREQQKSICKLHDRIQTVFKKALTTRHSSTPNRTPGASDNGVSSDELQMIFYEYQLEKNGVDFYLATLSSGSGCSFFGHNITMVSSSLLSRKGCIYM